MSESVNTALSPIETAVLETMLGGDDPWLAVLREQLQAAVVADREFTGVGFFTTFRVEDTSPSLPPGALPRRTIHADADIVGLEHGAGFILFVEGGRIDFLEGFTYDEPWPAAVTQFTVRRSANQ